jgi:ROK family
LVVYQRYPTRMPSEYCTCPPVPGHCAAVLAGTCASDCGNVTGSLPDGFTSPKSTAAIAFPSCVVGDAAELVGMHLAAVCNLLAPRRVIVTGPMAQAGELVLEPIGTAVRRRVAPNAVPEIVPGALGKRNTALGAIALALDETDWLPQRRPLRSHPLWIRLNGHQRTPETIELHNTNTLCRGVVYFSRFG